MLFKQALDLIKCKKHLTLEGLQEIVNIKASMNLEISLLRTDFPNTIPVARLSVSSLERGYNSINSFWMAGFVAGDGCFSVHLKKSPSSKLGETA
jgi:hypothetical protein